MRQIWAVARFLFPVLVVIVFLPLVASADNCGSLSDCWGTAGAAAGAAAGAGGAVGGGLGGGDEDNGDGDGGPDDSGDSPPEGGDEDSKNPCD